MGVKSSQQQRCDVVCACSAAAWPLFVITKWVRHIFGRECLAILRRQKPTDAANKQQAIFRSRGGASGAGQYDHQADNLTGMFSTLFPATTT